MAGLVAAIHVSLIEDVDGSNKSGHDEVLVNSQAASLQRHAIDPVIAHCPRQFDNMAMVREQDDLALRAAGRQ